MVICCGVVEKLITQSWWYVNNVTGLEQKNHTFNCYMDVLSCLLSKYFFHNIYISFTKNRLFPERLVEFSISIGVSSICVIMKTAKFVTNSIFKTSRFILQVCNCWINVARRQYLPRLLNLSITATHHHWVPHHWHHWLAEHDHCVSATSSSAAHTRFRAPSPTTSKPPAKKSSTNQAPLESWLHSTKAPDTLSRINKTGRQKNSNEYQYFSSHINNFVLEHKNKALISVLHRIIRE